MKFSQLLTLVESAKTAEDVVGPDDDGRAKRVKRARAELHPDRHSGTDRTQAEHAFARLEELLDHETRHVKAKVDAQFTITTKKRAYIVDGLAHKGLIANLYNVRYVREGDGEKHGLLKVVRSPRDNDLIDAEAKALRAIWSVKDDEGVPDTRRPFFPRPEEAFTYRDGATRIDRRAIVQRSLTGFVSLAEVRKHFPNGLDVRDLAWIWRRVLAGISLAHGAGFVHGSLTPEHIVIHPEVHGVQIVGWGQSVETGGTVKLLGSRDKLMYPSEILNKEEVSPATDIYTLHATMREMMDPHTIAARQFNAFIRGCMFDRQKTRPQDALVLLAEYDQLLERSFGERKFRQFPDFPGRAKPTRSHRRI